MSPPAWRALAPCLLLAGACVATPRSTYSSTLVPAGRAAEPDSTPVRETQAHAPRFYFGRDYGSEAQFNPLTQIVNEGFDVLRTRNEDRHILSRDYARAFRNIMSSVVHADRTFREYGVARAMRNEWLPLTLGDDQGGGAWVANYEFHAFGTGMVSVRMEEWFAQHGSAHPTLNAVTTIMASHLLNEVVENGSSRTPSEDAATDLLIFDPLGILLWRIDAVQRLFSGPLEMTNWPGQPTFDLQNQTLQNTGQQYIVRGRIPGTQRWRLMYDIGMSNLLGVSYVRPSGAGWSAAVGPYVVENPVVDSISGAKTATFRMNGGVFYDRNGSLLFSAIYSERSDIARVNMNLYPGSVQVGSWKPGLWLQVPPRGGVRFGVVSRIGLGLGYGPDR